ncbi:MAG: maleylacetate reductase [Cypionkella sp.]
MTEDPTHFALRLAPMRLRFGAPAAGAVAEELEALSLTRAVVLSTPGHADEARALATAIGARVVGTVARARMHTPVEVTEAALAEVLALKADSLISFGGGSTTGLGKALALRTDLLQIAVPTTYAGSEVTAILGQTEDGRKTTLADPRVQPEVIIYDPRLITGLPVAVTVTSGLNALAHAAEALYARDRNPLTTTLALQGIAAMVEALPQVVAEPGNLAARARTQYGAFLCGLVLGQVGMSLHHKLCHTLGGSFDLPHAKTHAVILPHAVAYNEAAVPDLLAPLAGLLGSQKAGKGLYDLGQRLNAPVSLKSLGLKENDLDRAAELATQNAYWNPRPVELGAIRALLQSAWAGEAPP